MMKLVSVDLVDREGASGMFQCRLQLGVVFPEREEARVRTREEPSVCLNTRPPVQRGRRAVIGQARR
jgi:hypothetical protein